MDHIEDLQSLIAAVCKNLDASNSAYQQYLAGGRTFRYALELKKYNGLVIELLIAKKDLLTPALQEDAKALLFHYNAWLVKWEQLAATLHPSPDDVFVFENDITFPKEAARNFEAARDAINNK